MTDSRSVRASSRRKTPTPQPPLQAARAPRTRALRSASRDIPDTVTAKPTRRSARQASVTTATDESENEGKATTRRTRRKHAKEAVGGQSSPHNLFTTGPMITP